MLMQPTAEDISAVAGECHELYVAGIGDRPTPKPEAIDYRSLLRRAFETVSPLLLSRVRLLTWDILRHDS